MKKAWIALLTTLLLFLQPLYALAEAAPPPVAPQNPSVPVMTAEEAAAAGRMEQALQVSVQYSEPSWDGMIEAIFTVTWPGTEAVPTAQNVRAHIQTWEGLEIVAGERNVTLWDLAAGESAVFGLILGYDRTIEQEQDEFDPTLVVTLYADNTDYTRYTAVMDGVTEPRVLAMAWEETDTGPRAMQANLDMIEDIFSKSYYNGRPFEVDALKVNEAAFESAVSRIAGWNEDANDVTYVYINAHGPASDGVPVAAFQADTVQSSVVIDGATYNNQGIVPYEALLTCLDQTLKGRVVIITEICYSGQLLGVAGEMGIDTEKFSILTAAPSNMTSQLWGDKTEKLKLDVPFSYGWFTNDLCDLLDAGYAKDANGVVTVGAAYNYLHDAKSALKSRYETAVNNTNEEDLLPTDISGLNDIFDTIDVWGERMKGWLDFTNSDILLLLDEAEPLEYLKQSLLLAIDWLDPQFGGNNNTLLYCSDPEYDDEKRMLTVSEEKWELLSAVELYYEFLRSEGYGDAISNEEIRGDEGYDAHHWSELTGTVGGTLSAVVCDLDKNGTPDMLTIEVDRLSEEEIEWMDLYFSVNLKLHQISDGQVIISDMIDDAIYVNERNSSCRSHTNFRLTEYEGQLLLECWASFTDGNSYDSGMNASYGFKDGKFVDPPERPSPYDFNYFTTDGRAYSPSLTSYEIGYLPDGSFRANTMGEFLGYINYIPYFYPKHAGFIYRAGDYTKLYEYLHEYEQEDYFTPLSYAAQPLPTDAPAVSEKDARRAEVEAAVNAAIAACQEEADSARFYISVTYKKNGDLSQVMIYTGKGSADEVDTELLRRICLSIAGAEALNLPAEAVPAVEGFAFKRGKSVTAGVFEMEFVQIPSGEMIVCITNDRGRK